MARLVEVFQSTGSVWSPTAGSEREREALRFQSTGSVWSPTTAFSIMKKHGDISIHGLRVEPDRQKKLLTSQKIHFNPRAPCGARPIMLLPAASRSCISIHGLRVEPDVNQSLVDLVILGISIHGLRVKPDQAAEHK